jgi:pimeloyl-ACP methyl ester carboxylesterase
VGLPSCFTVRLSDIFGHVLSVAASQKVRAVAINRRGYAESTPVNPEDIARLLAPESGQEFHEDFNLQEAALLAVFVATFISANELRGPCVLVGWSMGNRYTVPFLSPMLQLPSGVLQLLEDRLETIVLYGQSQLSHLWKRPYAFTRPF